MQIRKTISMAIAAIALAGGVQAATYTFVEGDRDDVIGATRVTADGSGADDTLSFDLTAITTTLGGGDIIDIHGRIIGFADEYKFDTNRNVRVTWIFNGYTTAAGFVAKSGFVANPFDDTESAPAELTVNPGAIGGVDSPFLTNICATCTNDNIKIFSQTFDPGTWTLNIDGLAGGGIDTYYDIRITAVPLPAGGLLLLTALGGLGIARRRRNKK